MGERMNAEFMSRSLKDYLNMKSSLQGHSQVTASVHVLTHTIHSAAFAQRTAGMHLGHLLANCYNSIRQLLLLNVIQSDIVAGARKELKITQKTCSMRHRKGQL